MINKIINIISKIYNEEIENLATRLLYFFNTINTYFILVGCASFLIVFPGKANVLAVACAFLFGVIASRIADFYPYYVIFSIPVIVVVGVVRHLPVEPLFYLIGVNIGLFFLIQFGFMGIPDSIVARDPRVGFLKMFHSLYTVAPTAVSSPISVYFSTYLAFCMVAAVSSSNIKDYIWLSGSAIVLLILAIIARAMRPANRFSKFHKLDIAVPLFQRVIVLNIDGARKDVFDSLNLPTFNRLKKMGAWHATGLETVYRALTNPALASIFTGTVPSVHGVHDNNFGQSISTEGLPDIVPSIAYGSMHVKHSCKKYWETKIFSLPRHSVYGADDIMVDSLKDDLLHRKEIRLFLADFSEADFLAHAYGSKSKSYKDALGRIDQRIGDLIDWMERKGLIKDTAIVVCSDHGIAAIDHSYLLAKSEKYVPFLLYGAGIKKGYQIQRPGKIMDICCTIAYLLGIRYPYDSRGQVFTDALEDSDFELETELLVERFNDLKYQAEKENYCYDHVEIYEGDSKWWDQCISRYALAQDRPLRILDIGCGQGFVAEKFISYDVPLKEFVCMDISEEILVQTRKNLKNRSEFTYCTDLSQLSGTFDLITVSSVFHHFVHPEKLATKIDSLLGDGGLVIGSHEPDNRILTNPLFRLGASLFKAIGGGISINEETVKKFNQLLHQQYPKAPSVCREEILQMVEYHSPIEQFDKGIDRTSGFNPTEFFNTYFPDYQILTMESYTTFFHRPWLSDHQVIQSILEFVFKSIFNKGNLFRFVLQKNKPSEKNSYGS